MKAYFDNPNLLPKLITHPDIDLSVRNNDNENILDIVKKSVDNKKNRTIQSLIEKKWLNSQNNSNKKYKRYFL